MNWILLFYKIVFAGLFKVIQGIEQAKVMIVQIIDGFFYQFIVAMLSLALLLYQGIGDQALTWMSAWFLGAGSVMTPKMSLIIVSAKFLPLMAALFIHGCVHRFMRWRGKEEQFRAFFSSQEKVLSHGLTFISIISMVGAFNSSGVRALNINMGVLIFTVIFFYMSVINEIYSVIAFSRQRKGTRH